MNAIRRLCQRALWLEEGKVRALGEVQDVVRQYEASFRGPEGIAATRVKRLHPPNSPKFFTAVSLAHANGEASTEFKFGDIIRLTAEMEGMAPGGGIYLVEWSIYERNNGIRIAWGSTVTRKDLDVPKGSTKVVFHIGPISLVKGSYSFSLITAVGQVATLDTWSDAITFEVQECQPSKENWDFTSQFGFVYIPYEINILNEG